MIEIQLPRKEEIGDLSLAQGLENINNAIEDIIDSFLHDRGDVINDSIVRDSVEKRRAVLVELNKKFHWCKQIVADATISLLKQNNILSSKDSPSVFASYETDHMFAAVRNELRKASDLFSFLYLVGNSNETPLTKDEALNLNPLLILDIKTLASSIVPLVARALLLSVQQQKRDYPDGNIEDILMVAEQRIRKHLRV